MSDFLIRLFFLTMLLVAMLFLAETNSLGNYGSTLVHELYVLIYAKSVTLQLIVGVMAMYFVHKEVNGIWKRARMTLLVATLAGFMITMTEPIFPMFHLAINCVLDFAHVCAFSALDSLMQFFMASILVLVLQSLAVAAKLAFGYAWVLVGLELYERVKQPEQSVA